MYASNDHQGRSVSDQNEINKLNNRMNRWEMPSYLLQSPSSDVQNVYYTEEDIAMFKINYQKLLQCLEDPLFKEHTNHLVTNPKNHKTTYGILHQYCKDHWPDRAMQIINTANGMSFISTTPFYPDIHQWQVGSRPEIVMAMMAQVIENGRPTGYPFLDMIFRQGFGYAKRRKFIEPWTTNFTEYHFVSVLVNINQSSSVYITISEPRPLS